MKQLNNPLSQGARGPEVRVLQFGLGIKTDGIFGPNTEQALKNWQGDLSLPETGVMTNTFWSTVFQSELEPMKHLRFAKLFLDLREEDVDHDGDPDNRGELIDSMVKSVWKWWEPGEKEEGPPWCAIFISYCLHASYHYRFESPRVKEWHTYLKEKDSALELKSKANFKKGNIYIGGYLNDNGYGHIFFVRPLDSLQLKGDHQIATIEGNTNEGGSREGNGVYERIRSIHDFWVYSLSTKSI